MMPKDFNLTIFNSSTINLAILNSYNLFKKQFVKEDLLE